VNPEPVVDAENKLSNWKLSSDCDCVEEELLMVNRLALEVAAKKFTDTVRAVAILVVILCVHCTRQAADPARELDDALRTMTAADGDKAAIQLFAERAAAADIQALIRSFDPAAQKAMGPAQMCEYLTQTVVPFFKDFSRVDTYETVAQAALPDGRVGTIHYTYIENTAGQKKPISIALIALGTGTGVVNVTVGECVKDRHPVSEGRCDR
jgi:hypothetical protein